MTDRMQQLVAAIYTALDGDSALATLLGATGKVFNGLSDQVAAPFVDIGEVSNEDYGSSSGDAQEHTITIHCWTEHKNDGASVSAVMKCTQIAAAVRAALHDVDLTLSAGSMANLRCVSSQPALRDPDGVSWHGVLRFRAVTEN